MNVSKKTEDASTITLGWTPPSGVGGYTMYANGQVVAVATAKLKSGSMRDEVKFSKSSPGPPFAIVATVRMANDMYLADVGRYPSQPSVVFPGNNRFPSEVLA